MNGAVTKQPQPTNVQLQQNVAVVQQTESEGSGWCCCFGNSKSNKTKNSSLIPREYPITSPPNNLITQVTSPNPTIQNQQDLLQIPRPTNLYVSPSERNYLLKPTLPEDVGKKCLVLDLDETLVHSSFKAVPNADFIIPVEIEGQVHNVFVLKRPHVDLFLEKMGALFEIVVFTASLAKYADPVLDMLDTHKVVKHRLFREACIHHKGNYVKDLSQLGRDLKDIIIIDNSPASYIFHPTNAIPISSWFSDQNDTELVELMPFLEDIHKVDNVLLILGGDS